LRITSCRFEGAAHDVRGEPGSPGPDVVFVGRSNVGKSSLINRLVGRRGLARTSSEPGRTRSVNFYRVNEACNFIDLPGYGYARVPREERRSWRPMVERMLQRRAERIRLVLVVVDARHPLSELDRAMMHWLESHAMRYVVAATKADKLSGNGRAAALDGLRRHGCVEPILVSARTGLGIRALQRRLEQALRGGDET
jgi:GTP-binding protein